jgi:hypothetical protein
VAQACCCAITNVLFQCCDVCDVLLLCCGCGAITHRRQVNQEQQLGLPVAPHMGAGDAATWAKMEVQFIDYVAGPLWERLGQVRPAVHGRHMLVVGPGEQPSHQPTGAALLLAAGVDRPRGTIPRSLGGGGLRECCDFALHPAICEPCFSRPAACCYTQEGEAAVQKATGLQIATTCI